MHKRRSQLLFNKFNKFRLICTEELRKIIIIAPFVRYPPPPYTRFHIGNSSSSSPRISSVQDEDTVDWVKRDENSPKVERFCWLEFHTQCASWMRINMASSAAAAAVTTSVIDLKNGFLHYSAASGTRTFVTATARIGEENGREMFAWVFRGQPPVCGNRRWASISKWLKWLP